VGGDDGVGLGPRFGVAVRADDRAGPLRTEVRQDGVLDRPVAGGVHQHVQPAVMAEDAGDRVVGALRGEPQRLDLPREGADQVVHRLRVPRRRDDDRTGGCRRGHDRVPQRAVRTGHQPDLRHSRPLDRHSPP